jgi:very-short-patch-repair endonuclease
MFIAAADGSGLELRDSEEGRIRVRSGLFKRMSPDRGVKTRDIGGFPHPEREIAVLAAAQHGVVAMRQLRDLGLGSDAVEYRVKSGRLHRVHHGVYAVGHRKLTREGHWMAAVLAYGPDALLSHRSAAALWGIWQSTSKIHITVPSTRRHRHGVRAHRADLRPEDRATRDGIPVTSLARTILDLAAELSQDHMTRVIENADRAQLLDLRAVERGMAAAKRPGRKALRAVLADYRGAQDTRSDLERDFLSLVKRARLPAPSVNSLVADVLVDACWPGWKLVVELDSRGFHTSPRAFERDRVRDATLQRAGFRVLRVTRKRLDREPQAVLEDVLALRQPRG